MGSRVGSICSLSSIPALIAALFAVDSNNNYRLPPDNSSAPIVRSTNAPSTLDVLHSLFGDGFNELLNQIKDPEVPDNENAMELRKIKGFEGREAYIEDLLKTLNPELLPMSSDLGEETALSTFNKKHNLSLICMGIKNKPCEFVFIDNNYFLGESSKPIRIALSLGEVTNLKSKEDVVNILEQKLSEHINKMAEQYKVWAKPYKYDFPKNNAACMFALSLSNLSGMETDIVSSLDMCKNLYGMSVEALCIDDAHKKLFSKLLKEHNYNDMPPVVSAKKGEILSQLEKSIKKAIDQKKEMFLFFYSMHGSTDGEISAQDGPFTSKDIAEVMSKPYKGMPLSAQIDLTVWAGSCYSGKQLDDMKQYFKERKNIPVKNLRIITESKYTTAGASTTPYKASLVSDLMTDKSGPLDYYRSWYREYLKHLENKGIRVSDPVGTYLHEVRFADLMTPFDTSNEQDSQGYHYSNDPNTNKIIDQYFTNFKPVISENQNDDNSAIV